MKYIYNQSQYYLEKRHKYIKGIEEIAKDFNRYLNWIQQDHGLKTTLLSRKSIFSSKNISEGGMWQLILEHAEQDVYICFKDFADYNPLIPLKALNKQLEAFKQAVRQTKNNIKRQDDSNEFHPLKNYSELTLEDLRQCYVDNIKQQMINLKKLIANRQEKDGIVAQVNDFCNAYTSWWGWISVFIFDLFNIPDDYRPLEAKSIDALGIIQKTAQSLERFFEQDVPTKNIFDPIDRPDVFINGHSTTREPNRAPTLLFKPAQIKVAKGNLDLTNII